MQTLHLERHESHALGGAALPKIEPSLPACHGVGRRSTAKMTFSLSRSSFSRQLCRCGCCGTGPFRIIRMSVIRLLRSSTFFQNRFGLVCVLIDVIIRLSHNSTFSLAKRACRIIRNGPVQSRATCSRNTQKHVIPICDNFVFITYVHNTWRVECVHTTADQVSSPCKHCTTKQKLNNLCKESREIH